MKSLVLRLHQALHIFRWCNNYFNIIPLATTSSDRNKKNCTCSCFVNNLVCHCAWAVNYESGLFYCFIICMNIFFRFFVRAILIMALFALVFQRNFQPLFHPTEDEFWKLFLSGLLYYSRNICHKFQTSSSSRFCLLYKLLASLLPSYCSGWLWISKNLFLFALVIIYYKKFPILFP